MQDIIERLRHISTELADLKMETQKPESRYYCTLTGIKIIEAFHDINEAIARAEKNKP